MKNKVILLLFIVIGSMFFFIGNVNAAESYTLTIEGGRIEYIGDKYQSTYFSSTTILVGTKVCIEASYVSDKYFSYWSTDNEITFDEDVSFCRTSFIMPDEDVNIKANNVNRSDYETIPSKDFTELDLTNFSNIDNYVSYKFTFNAPEIGDITATNKGNIILPDGMALAGLKYLDREGNEANKIIKGQTYKAIIYVMLTELKTFDDGLYFVKINGAKVKDPELTQVFEEFPNNYLMASVYNHFDANTYRAYSKSGSSISCTYKYLCFEVLFDATVYYQVSFNTNGHGTAPNKQIVIEDDKATKPTDLTATGYTFGGWYLDENCITEYDFNTAVTDNIILYAKWTRNISSYTYKFITGDNQELNINKTSSYVLKIDGDYTLFRSLKIGDLELEKNVDYVVTEGSTIITFTERGILKLNKLTAGIYDISAEFTNNIVTGKLTIKEDIDKEINNTNDIEDNDEDVNNANDIEYTDKEVNDNEDSIIINPKTGDNILMIIAIFIVATIGAYSTLKFSEKLQ